MAFLQSYIYSNPLGSHQSRANGLPPSQPLLDRPKGSDDFAERLLSAAEFLVGGLSHSERESTAIILGTHHGSLAVDKIFNQSRLPDHARYASPAAFIRTLPSSLPSELAIKLHLRGPSLTLSADAASGPLALARAIYWIGSGLTPYCLAGEFDFPSPQNSHFTLCLLSTQPPALATLTATITPPSPHPSTQIPNLSTLFQSGQSLHFPHPNITLQIHWSPPKNIRAK